MAILTDLDESTLRDLYVKQGLSDKKIAVLYGSTGHSVKRRRDKWGIFPTSKIEKASSRGQKPLLTEPLLRELYLEQGLTGEELASYFGVGSSTISRKRREWGIVTIDRFESRVGERNGRLEIIREIRRGGKKPVLCVCQCDCGKEHTVIRGNFERTLSCGCLSQRDYTGQRFHKLVVLEMVEKVLSSGKKEKYCCCLCDCGNETVVAPGAVLSGETKSCGCHRSPTIKKGTRFGRLVLQEKVRRIGKPGWFYRCLCDCGGENIVDSSTLKKGMTKSCGCLQKEISRLAWGESARNSVFSVYRQNARNRGLRFDLTLKEAFSFFQGNCYYCGSPPSRVVRLRGAYGSYTCNGIDRPDNQKGYVKGNMVSCCTTCNLAKREMKAKDFLDHVEQIRREWVPFVLNPHIPKVKAVKVVLSRYLDSAKRRGLVFALEEEDFWSLVSHPCSYCGREPFHHAGGGIYSGIDRLDSSLGYLETNCVPSCLRCNSMKKSSPVKDFLAWAKRIQEYQASLPSTT